MMDSPWGTQEGGSHYKDFKIQPAYFCYKNNIDFLTGNIIKYILRSKESKLADLNKAKHYLEMLIYEEELKDGYKESDDGAHTYGVTQTCGSSLYKHDRIMRKS